MFSKLFFVTFFITGSITHSAKRWYISYSEGDLGFFCPAGAARCTNGSEILMDFLKGLRSYGGFELRGSGFPKTQRPLAAKLLRTPKSYGGASGEH